MKLDAVIIPVLDCLHVQQKDWYWETKNAAQHQKQIFLDTIIQHKMQKARLITMIAQTIFSSLTKHAKLLMLALLAAVARKQEVA